MITLQVTPLQYDIIKAAVSAYTDNLMVVLDPPPAAVTVTQKPLEPVVGTVPTAVHHSMVGKKDAPWGLKKDGTPKARPGRKTVRRSRA